MLVLRLTNRRVTVYSRSGMPRHDMKKVFDSRGSRTWDLSIMSRLPQQLYHKHWRFQLFSIMVPAVPITAVLAVPAVPAVLIPLVLAIPAVPASDFSGSSGSGSKEHCSMWF